MTRLDQARQGYKNKNLEEIKKSHTSQAISDSLEHREAHAHSFNLHQIILGGQDGLVNVLGLILGIAAATASAKIVIIAGISATFAESISMAAVAYTSKLAEADHYQSELERERWEIENIPEGEREEIRVLYSKYGFQGKVLDEVVEKICSNKKIWLEVMMEQELKLEKVDRKEAIPAAIIVGISAIVGSFIPLMAFFFLPVKSAIFVSLIVSTLTLFVVGYYKAKKTLGRHLFKHGFEMAIIGMASAAVGYFIGNIFKI